MAGATIRHYRPLPPFVENVLGPAAVLPPLVGGASPGLLAWSGLSGASEFVTPTDMIAGPWEKFTTRWIPDGWGLGIRRRCAAFPDESILDILDEWLIPI